MTDTQQAATRTTGPASQGTGFTAAERAAMRERAKELKAAQSKADDERDCLAKIAEMQGADRMMAERLHALITATATDLAPKTWYGMPAYAKDGQIVCFFKSATRRARRGHCSSRQCPSGMRDPGRITHLWSERRIAIQVYVSKRAEWRKSLPSFGVDPPDNMRSLRIDATFPLADAAAAHCYLRRDNHPNGNVR